MAEIRGSLFGREQIKVICLQCKHTFPAFTDKIDPASSAPQLYNACPYCKRVTRIKVYR